MLSMPVQAALDAAAPTGSHAFAEHTTYLIDPGRTLTLEQVRRADAAQWQRVSHAVPNFGFTASVVWLRIPLEAPPRPAERFFKVGFALLDAIMFTQVADGSGETLAHYVAGEDYPFATRPVPYPTYLFPLSRTHQGASTLFLRLESKGAIVAPMSILDANTLLQERNALYLQMMVYAAIMLACLAVNAWLWWRSRRLLYGYLVLCIVASTTFTGQVNGINFMLFWPDAVAFNQRILLWSAHAALLFGALFMQRFLQLRATLPVMSWLLYGFVVVYVALAASLFQFDFRILSVATHLVSLALVVYLALCIGLLMLARAQAAKRFALASLPMLIGTALIALRNYGVVPHTPLTEHAASWGGLLMIACLSVLATQSMADSEEERRQDPIHP